MDKENKKLRLVILGLLTTLIFAKIDTKQLILITANSWSSNKAKLERYEKVDDKWLKIGKTKEVFLGKRGLAWGVGEHTTPKSSLIKVEGDKKSPAGVFKLPMLYSYNKLDISFPYIISKEYYHCVDDSNSRYYNMVVDSKKVKRDYKSFERMKFRKNYYKYALAINHNYFNSKKAIKNRGSCIFFHISNATTVGCTAFKKEKDMKELVTWLKRDKNPILIQAPKSEIKRLLKESGVLQPK